MQLLLAALCCLAFVSSKQVDYSKDIECSKKGPDFWCQDEVTAKQCGATLFCKEHRWNKKYVLETQDDTCTMCQQYVGTIHMLLSSNATQAELLNAMKTACSLLPSAMQSECSAIVDQYGQMAVDMVVQYTADPKNLCTMIGLCANVHGKVETFDLPKYTNLLMQKVNADYCMTCQQYLGTLHLLISNKETQATILNYLKSACTLLPSTVAPECSALMTIFGPKLIDYVVQYTADPSQFCTMIGLCKSISSAHDLVAPYPSKDIVKVSMEAFSEFNKPKFHGIQDDICQLCLNIVESFRNFLQENRTRQLVEDSIENLCSLVPPAYFSTCITYVDKTEPIHYNQLIKLLDPNATCTYVSLCLPSVPALSKQGSDEEVKPVSLSNGVTCELCTVAMGYLDSMLQENTTHAAVKQGLDELCGKLPASLGEECTILVSEYADQIITLLADELKDTTEICTEIKLCSAKKTLKKVAVVTKPSNIVTCEVCQYAMSYLDSMLEENRTEAAIEAALGSLCTYLPTAYKTECTEFVKENTDAIIKLLISEAGDPATLCKKLGLCSSSMKAVKPVVKKPENLVTCEVCQYAMNYLDSILEENRTEVAVKAALEQVCSYLPASYSSECTALVESYTDTIIQLLVQELADPKTICTQLGLCSAGKNKLTKPVLKKEIGNPVTCEVCKYAMSYLDQMLADNKTEAAVKAALDQLCSYLPSDLSSECTSLVNTYGDEIIKLIVQELANPATLCQELGLCSSSTLKKRTFHQEKSFIAGVECKMCMYAMGYLDQILTDKSTETEIETAVKSLCDKMPNSMSGECKSLVDVYGDAIITYLAQEFNPAKVCQYIGLCTAEKKVSGERKFMLAMRMPSLGGVTCQVCEYAMGYLDSLLVTKSTEAEIEAAVESLCSHLPAAIENECDALIKEYGDELIKLIVQQIKPDVVCKELKLC